MAVAMTQAKLKRLPTDLSRDDWIKAGFTSLTKSGPGGIKIGRLAKFLNISRGSFYWHFKSANAFKEAMIKHWVQVGTDDVITLAEGHAASPLEKLIALGRRVSGPRDHDYGGALAETAIRDWGRYDAEVSKAVEAVTRKRLSYLSSVFEEFGYTSAVARSRATLLYSAMVGLEFLSSLDLAAMDTELAALVQTFVQPSPLIANQDDLKADE